METKDMRQTYQEYLEQCKVYGFCPMDEGLWREWQVYYHGGWKG